MMIFLDGFAFNIAEIFFKLFVLFFLLQEHIPNLHSVICFLVFSAITDDVFNGARYMAELVNHYCRDKYDAEILVVAAGTGNEIGKVSLLSVHIFSSSAELCSLQRAIVIAAFFALNLFQFKSLEVS